MINNWLFWRKKCPMCDKRVSEFTAEVVYVDDKGKRQTINLCSECDVVFKAMEDHDRQIADEQIRY